MSKRSLTAKDRLVELAAGAVFFLALFLLAVFTIILQRDNLFGTDYNRSIVFENTGGLGEGDKILLRGMEVGKVRKVELSPDGAHIRVTVGFSRELTVYTDYTCQIRSTSMLGGQHIYLELGNAASGVFTGDLVGQPPADMFEAVNAAANEVRSFTAKLSEGEGTLHKLLYEDTLYEEVRATFKNLSDAGEKVGAAMDSMKATSDDVKEQLSTAKDAIASLEKAGTSIEEAGKSVKEAADTAQTMVANVNAAVDEARAGKGTIGKLLTDDTLYDDAKSMIADLSKAAERLNSENSSLSKVMSDDGALYDSLKGGFDAMGDTMRTADEIAKAVKSGEGTLGKLVSDDSLYEDARSTIKEVQGAVSDFREQAPILTFGSFIFGSL